MGAFLIPMGFQRHSPYPHGPPLVFLSCPMGPHRCSCSLCRTSWTLLSSPEHFVCFLWSCCTGHDWCVIQLGIQTGLLCSLTVSAGRHAESLPCSSCCFSRLSRNHGHVTRHVCTSHLAAVYGTYLHAHTLTYKSVLRLRHGFKQIVLVHSYLVLLF